MKNPPLNWLTEGLTRAVSVGVATAGGVGFLPLAPGTFGALVGVGLFVLLSGEGFFLYLCTTLVLGALGVWASGQAEHFFGREDDGRIVIDEVVGQLITFAPLVGVLGVERLPRASFFALVVTGFVAFRVFDIAKPGWIGKVEKNTHGGAGVMADDIAAGLMGALVVAAVAAAFALLASDPSAAVPQ
ncbi:MAG: phosphatidylglycerophosphatase A [Myxococcota bacterium]|nr:phosphatidylglycerophosphatase A [Myxococcota bacterium]